LGLPHEMREVLAAMGDQERRRLVVDVVQRAGRALAATIRWPEKARADREATALGEVEDARYGQTAANHVARESECRLPVTAHGQQRRVVPARGMAADEETTGIAAVTCNGAIDPGHGGRRIDEAGREDRFRG